MSSKADIRPFKHHLIPGAVMVEVWHEGEFVCSIYGADGPGIRVISKNELKSEDVVVPELSVIDVLKTP